MDSGTKLHPPGCTPLGLVMHFWIPNFRLSVYIRRRASHELHFKQSWRRCRRCRMTWSGPQYGGSTWIPRGICWEAVEFPLHQSDGAYVRETPPLVTAGFEMHALRHGCSLPISRSACVVQCYASRFRTYTTYQPHTSVVRAAPLTCRTRWPNLKKAWRKMAKNQDWSNWRNCSHQWLPTRHERDKKRHSGCKNSILGVGRTFWNWRHLFQCSDVMMNVFNIWREISCHIEEQRGKQPHCCEIGMSQVGGPP